jgi:hypothetical protein
MAGFARQGVLVKGPTVWLNGARSALNTILPNPKTPSVDWPILLSGNTPNAHNRFINILCQ